VVLDLGPVAHRLAVDADHEIAGVQARGGRRRLRVDHADEWHERRVRDADAPLHRHLAVAVAHDLFDRGDVALEYLAVARQPQVQLLARRVLHGVLDLFPVAHRAAVDLHHAIARLEPGARRDAAVEHVADHRGGSTVWPAKNTK